MYIYIYIYMHTHTFDCNSYGITCHIMSRKGFHEPRCCCVSAQLLRIFVVSAIIRCTSWSDYSGACQSPQFSAKLPQTLRRKRQQNPGSRNSVMSHQSI